MAARLILKFTHDGKQTSVPVETPTFSVGRGAENDLAIASAALSRRHVEITRYADIFVARDCGSSNGTTINGATLGEPIALKDADRLVLGGDITVSVELQVDEAVAEPGTNGEAAAPVGSNSATAPTAAAAAPANAKSSLKGVFLIAPIAGVLVLLGVGGAVLLSGAGGSGSDNSSVARREDDAATAYRSDDRDELAARSDESEDEEEPEETPAPRRTPNAAQSGQAGNLSSLSNAPANAFSSELEKTERFAVLFLRGVASDTNAVLTTKQLQAVAAKIRTIKNSAGLRENLRQAARDKAAIQIAAQAQNLTASFVTSVALAELGDKRGEVAATAQTLAPKLGGYVADVGAERANDCLLLAAAYKQGIAPEAMRQTLENFARQRPDVSATTIRNVLFLRENKELSETTYDFIVRLLAIGTIAQNPKEFGINVDSSS